MFVSRDLTILQWQTVVQGQVAMDQSNPEAAAKTPSNSAEEPVINKGAAPNTDANRSDAERSGTGQQQSAITDLHSSRRRQKSSTFDGVSVASVARWIALHRRETAAIIIMLMMAVMMTDSMPGPATTESVSDTEELSEIQQLLDGFSDVTSDEYFSEFQAQPSVQTPTLTIPAAVSDYSNGLSEAATDDPNSVAQQPDAETHTSVFRTTAGSNAVRPLQLPSPLPQGVSWSSQETSDEARTGSSPPAQLPASQKPSAPVIRFSGAITPVPK